MEVQVRSEETGIKTFPTVKEAMDYAEKDDTVWKVSFSISTGERVRLTRYDGHSPFEYEPMEIDWERKNRRN
jgi:hypothetical protein